jgi:hypothetical protein
MRLKYIGSAAALHIPARDLTAEEVQNFGEANLLALVDGGGSPLYRKFTKRELEEIEKPAEPAEGKAS